MNVLVVEPGFYPYEKEVNGLSEMQKLVGGLIQAIYPFQEEVAVVCNEEGINLGLEFNRMIPERSYGGIFGTFFVCGLGGDHFVSLTPEQVKNYTERFKKAEVFIPIKGTEYEALIKVKAKRKYPAGKPPKPRKPPSR